jgi:D-alanyl-D-alanine carboxypeptidase
MPRLPHPRVRSAAAAAVLATAGLAASLTPAVAAGSSGPLGPSSAPPPDAVQHELDALVSDTGFPGVIATVRDADGSVHSYTAGTSDLDTGAPIDPASRVRIASNTKMFTSTVVLQLVAEGKVRLGARVEHYLPGLVRGHGNDGRKITVHQLLQQTSGLPDYDEIVLDGGGSLRSFAHTYVEPRQLVDAALAERHHFAPGTEWEYSNTNYILLGPADRRADHPAHHRAPRTGGHLLARAGRAGDPRDPPARLPSRRAQGRLARADRHRPLAGLVRGPAGLDSC